MSLHNSFSTKISRESHTSGAGRVVSNPSHNTPFHCAQVSLLMPYVVYRQRINDCPRPTYHLIKAVPISYPIQSAPPLPLLPSHSPIACARSDWWQKDLSFSASHPHRCHMRYWLMQRTTAQESLRHLIVFSVKGKGEGTGDIRHIISIIILLIQIVLLHCMLVWIFKYS